MITRRSLVLIDDDKDDQEIFRAACQSIDETIDVYAFEHGDVALRELNDLRIRPEVVFVDLNMPRMNGIEVLTAIKNSNTIHEIPVIVYTTYFDEKVKNKCFDLGAFGIIEKPDTLPQLCAKIESFLQELNMSA